MLDPGNGGWIDPTVLTSQAYGDNPRPAPVNDVPPTDLGPAYVPPVAMPETTWRPPDEVLSEAYGGGNTLDEGIVSTQPGPQSPDAVDRNVANGPFADFHLAEAPIDITSGARNVGAAQAVLSRDPFGRVAQAAVGLAGQAVGVVNDQLGGTWESVLGQVGLNAQKLRESLDPNVRYTASAAYDLRMAQIARDRGVPINDISLAGDRLQVARDIFNGIEEQKQTGTDPLGNPTYEPLEAAAARSPYGLSATPGLHTVASFANPLYAIGPGEVGNVISAGARAGRAVSRSAFAAEEAGMALPDLGVKAILDRIGGEARSRIESLRGEVGDFPATIAHHPDVKAAIKGAIIAEGEAPTAQNLTQVVRAIMDGPTLGAEQAARDIGGAVEQQAQASIPKTADLQAAHVADVAPLGEAVPSTGVTVPKPGEIRSTSAQLNRLAKELDAGSPPTRYRSTSSTTGISRGAMLGGDVPGAQLDMSSVVGKAMTPEYRQFFEEKVQPVMELRQNILDAQKRLKEIETGPAAAYVRLTDPGDQLLWYEEQHPDIITKAFADSYFRPPEEIVNQGGETLTAWRQHIIDMANESVKKATADEIERFGSPVHEYPELGTTGKDAALRIDAERSVLQRQLAEDHKRAQDLIAEHRGGASGQLALDVPATVPGEIPGTEQTVLPGTPPAEAPTLSLENPTVSEAAARSTRVEASQEGLFQHQSGAVTRAPEPQPLSPTERTQPQWLREEMDRQVASAKSLGIHDDIVALAQQKKTAAEIVTALKSKLGQMTDQDAKTMIRAVRSRAGISPADVNDVVPATSGAMARAEPNIGDRITLPDGRAGEITDIRGGGNKYDVMIDGEDVATTVKKSELGGAPVDSSAMIPESTGGSGQPPVEPPTATADPLFSDQGPDVPQDSIQTANGPLDLNKAIDILTSDTRLEKTKTIGHKQTMREAADLLKSGKISEDTLFAMAETGAYREAPNAAEVVAYDQLVGGLAERAARAAESGSGDMFDRITEAVAAKQKWRALMEEPGRATEAMKMLSDSGELARDAQDVTARAIELFGGITEEEVRAELTGAFKEFLASVGDPAARESAARNFMSAFEELMTDAGVQKELDTIPVSERPGVIRGVLTDLRMGNLLGYLTGAKNLITNEVKVAAIVAKYAAAAAVPGAPQRLADIAPAVRAMRIATGVGAKDAFAILVHGPDARALAGRFYEGRQETIPRLLGNVTEKIGLGRGLGENVGGVAMSGARLSAAGDVFTRTQLERFYEVTRSAQLLREKGLTGTKYDQALSKAIAKPRALVKLEAQRFGRVETWNEARDKVKYLAAMKGGAGEFGSLKQAPLYALGKGIGITREATDPVLSTIMPFFQTRLNMLDEGINWSPVGALRITKEWRGLSAAERADRIAQTAIGTAGLGTALATILGTDAVTGSGPLDTQKNIAWSKDHQPYSISIPGIGWVSYQDALGPLGAGIAYVADYADAAKYDGHIPDDRNIFASVAHFSKTLFNQSGFPQNLSDFLDTMVNPSADKWAALTANVVREYLPAPGGTANLRVTRAVEGIDTPKYDKTPLTGDFADQLGQFAGKVDERVRGQLPPELGGTPQELGVYQRARTGLRAMLPITTQEDTSNASPDRQPMLQIPLQISSGAGAAGAAPSPTVAPAGPGGRYVPPARR